MARKKGGGALAGRAWIRLRLAMLWIRKGGAFEWGRVVELPLFRRCRDGGPKNLNSRRQPEISLYYGERQMSFPDTPEFELKIPSTRYLCIPCITPAADDLDYEEDSLLFTREEEIIEVLYEADVKGDQDEEEDGGGGEKKNEIEMEMEGIDWEAEEFIRKFYEQLKLDRQVSLIRYNEMLERGRS